MLKNYNQQVILSDKIKKLKFNKLPPQIILNKNDYYTLLLKPDMFICQYELTNTTLLSETTLTVNLPIRQLKYTKFFVDWGDDNNSISTYIYDDLSGDSNYDIHHNYTLKEENQIVQIMIYGDFKGFDNKNSAIQLPSANYLYNVNLTGTTISGSISSNFTNYYLRSILSWGNTAIQSLENFCLNASGLISIPNYSLPNVNNCNNAFYNCVNLYKCFNNLTNSMNYFQLPKNVTNCQNMFRNTNIQYNFSNLDFPQYLTNIAGMFYNTQINDINSKFYKQFCVYGRFNNYIQLLSAYYRSSLPQTVSSLLNAGLTSTEIDILTGNSIIDSINYNIDISGYQYMPINTISINTIIDPSNNKYPNSISGNLIQSLSYNNNKHIISGIPLTPCISTDILTTYFDYGKTSEISCKYNIKSISTDIQTIYISGYKYFPVQEIQLNIPLNNNQYCTSYKEQTLKDDVKLYSDGKINGIVTSNISKSQTFNYLLYGNYYDYNSVQVISAELRLSGLYITVSEKAKPLAITGTQGSKIDKIYLNNYVTISNNDNDISYLYDKNEFIKYNINFDPIQGIIESDLALSGSTTTIITAQYNINNTISSIITAEININ